MGETFRILTGGEDRESIDLAGNVRFMISVGLIRTDLCEDDVGNHWQIGEGWILANSDDREHRLTEVESDVELQ
jgi:hypothetical protein